MPCLDYYMLVNRFENISGHFSISFLCTEVKSRIEAQQLVIQQLEVSLREKERDCAERINAVREEEFQKLSLVSLPTI